MKKGYKIILLVAIIFFILGMILTAIGLGNNASRNINIGNMNIGIGGFMYGSEKKVVFDEDIKPIKSIDIDSDISRISIIRGEKFHIYEEMPKNYFHKKNETYEITDDGTLKIKRTSSRRFGISIFGNDNSGRIEITIPKEVKLDNIELRSNVGEIELEKINSKNMYIKTNVGSASAYEVNSDSMEIITNVGEVDFENSMTKKLYAKTNIGKINFEGEINGDIDIKTDIGEAKLELRGNIDDYNINGKSGVGSIKINRKSLSSFKNSRDNTKKRPFNIDLNSGVGDIKLDIY